VIFRFLAIKNEMVINDIMVKLIMKHSTVMFFRFSFLVFTIVLSNPRNNPVVTIAVKDEKTPHSPNISGSYNLERIGVTINGKR
jgi:hypothetical protein